MNDAWAADHYRQLFERQLNESYRYQALLYHAWNVIRQQNKGLQRQRRLINRLRRQSEVKS